MNEERNLQALLRSREAEEKQALLELRRIEEARAERADRVRAAERKYLELQQEFERVNRQERAAALRQGRSTAILEGQSFLRKLKSDLEKEEQIVATLTNDLKKAEVRASIAQQEALTARVERKKVETLIEGQARVTAARKGALDEIVHDELSQRKR